MGIRGILEEGHAGEARHGLGEQLEPFPGEFGVHAAQPRDVPSRPRQARDEPVPHGIDTGRHDDGDGAGRVLGRQGGGGRPHNDEIYAQAHQVGSEVRPSLGMALVPADLEGNRLALDVAQVTQPLAESIEPSVRFPRPRRGALREHAEARDLPC